MKNTYQQLIEQTFDFPQTNFRLDGGRLCFNDIPLWDVIERFGSPLKLTFLPKIRSQIDRARALFAEAFEAQGYEGRYIFTYCTKSSHFAHTIKTVLSRQAHLELSSAFDIDIILELEHQGLLNKDIHILCNGYKTPAYFKGIQTLMQRGFKRVMPILDCKSELDVYATFDVPLVNIGLRVATEEEPTFDLYTSRFGIRQKEIVEFYETRIKDNPKFALRMLHSFVYTGIKDTTYYWSELLKYIHIYTQLQPQCPTLKSLNLGGGLPIQNNLEFDYDYKYMINEIVLQLKEKCEAAGVPHPHIFSEFGTFTVGESGATIFKVLGTKRQNDREAWYLLDNSLITTLPDMWAEKQQFILLPINKWDAKYQRVILGGLTCDNDDFYNVVSKRGQVYLPAVEAALEEEPLYIGFFHTGAYQEALSGYGGIKHCLIPSPKHVLVDQDEAGNFSYEVFAEEQSAHRSLEILGYHK